MTGLGGWETDTGCRLAELAEAPEGGGRGVGVDGRQPEAGVEDPALAHDRGLGHVEGAAEVHGDVAGPGGQRDAPGGPWSAGRSAGHTRARWEPATHLELARDPVGAGHRDAGGQAAAVVAVSAERAVLVPGDVRDPPGHADGLEQRLDAVGPVGSPAVTVAGERGDRRRSAGRRPRPPCAARPRRSAPCAPAARRRRRWSPTTSGRRPASSGGAAASMSAETAAISSWSKTPGQVEEARRLEEVGESARAGPRG